VSAAALKPLGFVLLMLGFGLRLDTGWQGAAWLFLVAGALCIAAGLYVSARRESAAAAFVPPPGRR
jgi:sulfite exporter TauE/SafE